MTFGIRSNGNQYVGDGVLAVVKYAPSERPVEHFLLRAVVAHRSEYK